MLLAKDWQEYECLEIGDYYKIERFGNYIFKRPEPTAKAALKHKDYHFDGQFENGQWKRTVTPAIQLADKYKAIYSKDVKDFSAAAEDSYANRANCDALGRVIHNTHVTISELQSIIAEEVKKQLSTQ